MISAPGKLVLAGEYAVLDGHPGLVMAVGRRVKLISSQHLTHSRLWDAVAQHACEPRFKIDSTALYEGSRKLGLGSSAAAAVCMAAYLKVPNIYQTALEGHRRFSEGLGSGIDIAASYHGGLLRFQSGQATQLKPVFDSQSLLCVFTKKSQNTRIFLAQVLDYQSREPENYARLMTDLGALTPAWESVYTGAQSFADIGKLIQANLTLLAKLSQKAKIGLLTPEQEQIAAECQKYGASSKPSGAGGGDITLCYVPPENRAALSEALRQLGFLPLNLDYFAPGLEASN
jgi:phosphomevalonate kinase